MHGLVNRAIERFVRDTYGRDVWIETIERLDLGYTEFEAMMMYEVQVTEKLLVAVGTRLKKTGPELFEDIGTYMISHSNIDAPRRLLRFGGVDFVDFLHSLDDLPERARLAVPDIDLPSLELHDHGGGSYGLSVGPCAGHNLRFGHVAVGVLRAMADDYGALVFLEHSGVRTGQEVILIRLLETAFASGRDFELGVGGLAG